MPNNFNLPPSQQIIETTIYEGDGQPALTIQYKHRNVIEPDGTVTELTQAASIILPNGTVWNPSMMSGNNAVMLAVCATCRNPIRFLAFGEPATHGLHVKDTLTNCCQCGIPLCARHRVRYPHGSCRCFRCARRHRLKRWLQPLFFTTEDA